MLPSPFRQIGEDVPLDRVRCARRVASGLGSIGPQIAYTFEGGKRFPGRLICEGETHEV